MDYEYLLSGPRWEILKLLSQGKRTPTELARALNTTLANISQHLRLLEMVGLVKKERLKNSEKGKPRLFYSISQDFTFLATISQNRVYKKLRTLAPHELAIVNIIFLENEELRRALQKWFFRVENIFPKLKFVGLLDNETKLLIYSLIGHSQILAAAKESELSKQIDIEIVNTKSSFVEQIMPFVERNDVYVLYDPSHLLENIMHNIVKQKI